MRILKGRKRAINSLAFGRGHNLIAAGGRGSVHVWDSASGELLAEFPTTIHFPSHQRMQFVSEHELLIPNWESYMLCDVRTQKMRKPFRPVRGWSAYHVGAKADTLVASSYTGVLRGYRVEGKKLVRSWQSPTKRSEMSQSPRITLDGRTVISVANRFVGDTGRIAWCFRAHAMSDGKQLAEWVCPLSAPFVEVDDTCRWLAAFTDFRFALWNYHDPQEPPRIVTSPSQRNFMALAFHPTGDQLATLANDRYVRLWDTRTLQLQTTLEWNIGKLHAVGYSDDGLRAAVGSGTGKVLVWDVE